MNTARLQTDVTTMTTKRPAFNIDETDDHNAILAKYLMTKWARKNRKENPDVENVAVTLTTSEPSLLSLLEYLNM
ncbi:unnamed protein product [Allacma fusca]|uniref:Uncharacterized protein n=1 Tax=Allacma fusca TaxID=39272 RepID=A0A8J2L2W3_9HEXA|nr:unnamed protein product [Allacma fusca]